MAKIELVARPIDIKVNIGGKEKKIYPILERYKIAPQHLFVMISKDNGAQSIISGSPEDSIKISGMIWDDIKVKKQRYGSSDEKEFNKYFKSTKLYEGRDKEVEVYVNKMWDKASEINRSGFDYKLPTMGDEQNSNTVARIIVEAAGLKFELPKYLNGKPVIAPSYESEIKHTKIDKLAIGNKVKEFLYQKEVMRKLVDKINKAYAKYNAETVNEIKDCVDKELNEPKKKVGLAEQTKKGIEIADYIIGSKVWEDTSGNVFDALENNAKAKGDTEYANLFGHLADQQKEVNGLFDLMDSSIYKNAESTEDKLRYIDENIQNVRDASNSDERKLEKITLGYKENIVVLDHAFEKCAPDSFYNEDL